MQLSRVWLYRAEVAVALLSAATLVAAMIDPQWIEALFDESRGSGDGGAQRWLVGGGLLMAVVIAALLAWRERRRMAARGLG